MHLCSVLLPVQAMLPNASSVGSLSEVRRRATPVCVCGGGGWKGQCRCGERSGRGGATRLGRAIPGRGTAGEPGKWENDSVFLIEIRINTASDTILYKNQCWNHMFFWGGGSLSGCRCPPRSKRPRPAHGMLTARTPMFTRVIRVCVPFVDRVAPCRPAPLDSHFPSASPRPRTIPSPTPVHPLLR